MGKCHKSGMGIHGQGKVCNNKHWNDEKKCKSGWGETKKYPQTQKCGTIEKSGLCKVPKTIHTWNLPSKRRRVWMENNDYREMTWNIVQLRQQIFSRMWRKNFEHSRNIVKEELK